MISAVLVFNNTGQPRLTKFYTQLVRTFPLPSLPPPTPVPPTPITNDLSGHLRAAAPNLRDIHLSRQPPIKRLQFPPSASPPTIRLFHFHHLYLLAPLIPATHRPPHPRNLPTLRDPLLHPNLHLHRVSPCASRPDPSLRRSARPALRKCLRARSHIQF